jgi:hypothetical protein
MGDAMTIQPIFFNFVFFIILLAFGIDFTLSGYLAIKEIKHLERPKLLGLMIMAIYQRVYERAKKPNKLLLVIYSHEYMKIYTLIGGILIIIGSLMGIFDLLLKF